MLSTASDGLLKLWTVKTRQCVQTFDQHQDKAWAMAVSGDEKRVVTGGEDAALVLWRDVTEEEKEKAAEEAARYSTSRVLSYTWHDCFHHKSLLPSCSIVYLIMFIIICIHCYSPQSCVHD